MFFGANDPLHFRSVPIALLSLFRAATLEDWTDIMYISIFGCDKYTSGLYYVKVRRSPSPPLVAVIVLRHHPN